MMHNQESRNKTIAGASFSLYPMSDDFVDIIKGSIHNTDVSKVWMKTDDVTTTVSGKVVHIFDVTKSILIDAAKTDKHVGFQATYSFGCSAKIKEAAFLSEDDTPVNQRGIADNNRYAAAKFSLYPLGEGNYMDIIHEQIDKMKNYVTVTTAHYSTKLEGSLGNIFTGLEQTFQATMDKGVNHFVMTVSISVNSPSHQGRK